MLKLPVLEQLSVLSQKVFSRSRSLLFPMLLLALGFHAALLALPLPSSEGRKTPDDQNNPVKITQIPTENLAAKSAGTTGGTVAKVAIPPIGETTVADSSSTDTATTDSPTTDTATDTSTRADDSSSPASATPPASTPSKQTKAPSPAASKSSSTAANRSEASQSEAGSDASDMAANQPNTSSAEPAPDASTANPAPTGDAQQPADPSSKATNSAQAASPFANFPHYQPSVADCYSLGFGENCRVVSNSAIAQVTDFFRKELAAKEFQTNLVSDEPTHKVLKVSRDNKTMFLNIWQAKKDVAYLLAGVVYKQSPADIQTETGK